MWWNRSLMLSHNKILNMILSNRGGGKTFDCTRWCIDDFKKNKKQAVWVRRYNNELHGKGENPGILDDNAFYSGVIKEGLYEGDKLEIQGNIGYVNDEPAIYFVALSTSRKMKSMNFPNVNKIIFDEFIIDKGRTSYLKNEVEVFLDLYETVDRMRDETRAVLLANSITIVNPYFSYFNIKPKDNKRFTIKGEVCVEIFSDAEFIAKKMETRFGKLTKGTRYGEYAINNKWLLDNDTFIEPKTPGAEFMLALKYEGVVYGYWIDYKVGLIFVNKQYDPSSYAQYCLQKDDHDPNLLLIKSLSECKPMQRIIYAFRNGLIRFDDMVVKNQFYEYIGLFVR